ncbi:lytic polysaccharide monooxygenase [Cytobacillus kochii]|uniref:lytic polysaccharide monooxygenase n=1 Tax=Cytobacillus kochii TaxID=859143 RepID=UPI00247FB3E2|nr:lytic polysaccharide monooxygenase [Cytobacillus kochii]MDM5206093.1 lytic polysaccharide monooxygenase [Cytobacillus kochii]
MNGKKKRYLSVAILMTAMLMAPGAAFGHGYVEQQPSRALLCAQGVNENCGGVQYEPQSTETTKGFPEAGLADGQFASANGIFPELDEQSETRWAKVDMDAGEQTFTWHLTAAHSTAKWHYYITKENWDPNAPLTRDQFELTPFFEENDHGAVPGSTVSHEVTVPEREGYHVILAVWDVANTSNAFYHVIDAEFSGENNIPTPEPDPEPTPEPEEPSTDPEPETPIEGDTWQTDTIYVEGDRVIYNGLTYEAQWWTKGDQPGISSVWQLISEAENREWNSEVIYYGGDQVLFNGQLFKAKWWSKGDVPGESSVWEEI